MSGIYPQDIWPERKFIIYKTTNLVNGMYYIGRRILQYVDDSYIGSGKPKFENAIKKYGKHNFKREILYAFDNKQDMVDKEKEIVNKDVVNDEMSYNIRLGGIGGSRKGRKITKEHKHKISKANKGKERTEEHRQKIRESLQGEESSSVILTEKQVIKIKTDPRLHQWGGVTKIAKEYDVSRSTISNIKHGYKWKHILIE